jgi:hypothetical protein
MRPQRQYERKVIFAKGEKAEKVLDARNERFVSEEGRILHPTKGFRKVSEKRGRAQMIMAEQRKGIIPPTIFVLSMVKLFITTGRWK